MKNQIEYLKKLQEIVYNEILVSKNVLKDKEYKPTYRVAITDDNQIIDHRIVGSNEIVFDFDFTAYVQTYKHAKMIISVLEERRIPYYIFATGGKGIHIHIFFDKIEFNNEEIKKLFKEAISYDFTWKHIRQFIFNLICDDAGISQESRTQIDTKKISFNDLEGSNVLIRCCGGRNQKFDDVTGETTTLYKTWIPNEEFNNKKIKVSNIENVKYPEKLETFKINISELGQCLKDYVKQQEANKIPKHDEVKFPNGYTGLSSVQKILEGMQPGTRNEGARILASALILDGFGDARAEQVMKQYVDNCSQIGHQFTFSEAMGWYKWMKHQPTHFWNNEQVKKLGVWEKETDDYHKVTKHETIKLLENKGLLKRIDDYLKTVIVGEENIRMLIFLLLLSSKFKVKKDWNIKNDPKPQSIILSSLSSSGKSYVTKEIMKLFGEDTIDYYAFSRMTGKVLNYFCDIDMTGKILFVEELQGLDAESNQLRLWISEGQLKLATVEKESDEDGQPKNKMVWKTSVGQPVFITGTAEDKVDDQMNNRSWLMSLDISQEQNKAILDYESRISMHGPTNNDDELRILRDSIKELKSYHFIIPYLNYKWLNIPTTDVRIRRDFQKFSTLICCVALLHQKQRYIHVDKQGREYIVCNLDDYEIAAKFSEKVLESTFSGLTNQQIMVLEQIKIQAWRDEFELSDVQRLTSWGKTKCWTILNQLEEIGCISSSGKKPGTPTIYALNPKKTMSILNLPTKEMLLKLIEKENSTIHDFLKNYDFYYSSATKTADFEETRKLMNEKLSQFASNTVHTEINDVFSPISVTEYPEKHHSTSACPENLRIVKGSENSDIYVTKDMLLLFFDEQTEQKISEEKIIQKFGKDAEKLLKKMAFDGDIFSPRPGYWVKM